MEARAQGSARPRSPHGQRAGAVVDQEEFILGDPTFICRWRLAKGQVPLLNRHLRALRTRRVNGAFVTTELVAWVKQHLEWTLEKGSEAHPDGVLLFFVDGAGKAALAVGPYQPLPVTTLSRLARRGLQAVEEALQTGVAPETLCIVRDGVLRCGIDEGCHASGSLTLMTDLASTLGMSWSRESGLAEALVNRPSSVDFDEAFLVSDEHGVVRASDAAGPVSLRFFEGYARLLEMQGSHRRR